MCQLINFFRPLAKPFHFVTTLLCLSFSASAQFPVFNQVESLYVPVEDPAGSPLVPGTFIVRAGYFNYSNDFSANNAAIQADASNQTALEDNFRELFRFDGTEGDTGVNGVNADAGAFLGGDGFFYGYFKTTSGSMTTTFSEFQGKRMHAWIQLKADPGTQFIATNTDQRFAGGTDVFSDANATFAIIPGSSSFQLLVGTTTATSVRLATSATTSTFAFTSGTFSVSENAGTASVSVARSGKLSGTVSVAYATANGSALAGTDYTVTSGTLTFNPNVTSQLIPIPIADIPLFQGDRSFTVALSNPSAEGELGSPSTTTVTILDDEAPQRGTIKLSATAYSGIEDAGPIDVTIERVGGTDGPVSITIDTANNGAVAGSDYTAISGTVVSFANGDAGPKIVSIPISADPVFETDETFTVTLSNPTGGAALGSPSSATVTILNDDSPPSAGAIAFSATGFSGSEDGGFITISAVRTSGSAGAVSAEFTTSNGTAVDGVHYLASTGTFTWENGEDGAKSLTIPVIDNNDDEPDRDFTVSLSTPTGGAVLVEPASATVSIIDDDIAGAFSFNPTLSSVEEGQVTELVIERTGGTDGNVSLTVNTVDGSAIAGTDYVGIVGQVVNFPNGVTSGTVSVSTTDDAVFKGNRTFTATLSAPSNGATIGVNSTHTVTITDNEVPSPGTIRFARDEFNVREGNPAKLRVNRVGGTDLDVTVDYQVQSGTAISGLDFPATAGTLTFLQGESVKFIEVPTNDDSEVEKTERFTVILANPGNGATLGKITKARVNLLDNDKTPGFSFEFQRYPAIPQPKPTILPALDEGQSQTINVLRTGLLDQTLKVRVRTISASAIMGEDFVPLDEILTFGPNETSKTVTVTTLIEPVIPPAFPVPEDIERFQVILENMPSNPSGVRLKNPAVATVVIGRNFAVDQPDLHVKAKTTEWFGNDVYNTTGNLQTATRLVKGGAEETFNVRVQNDGNVSDVFVLRATQAGTAPGSAATFSYNSEPLIRRILQGSTGFITPRLQPGESIEIQVMISLAKGAKLNEGHGVTITAQSLYSAGKTDTAKAAVFRGF